MGRAKKRTFTLHDTPAIQILLSHYTSAPKQLIALGDEKDNIPETILPTDDNDIPINDLLYEKSKRVYYFLDPHKIQTKYWGNMIDVTINGPLPSSTNKPCWWDRHVFTTTPIGCPLRYHPNKKDGLEKERFEKNMKSANINVDSNNFFETEGYFCSFPCCHAYILSQRNSVKYKDSAVLLSRMFEIFHGIKANYPTAPSWKILKEYGGHLTVQEYRATFGKLEYVSTVNVRRPYMFSSSQYLAEKRIKMFRGVKD